MSVNVKIKKLRNDAVLPEYKTAGAAGMDVCYSGDEDILLHKGERKLVPCGFSMSIDTNEYAVLLYARSGLAINHGITMVNGVGVIDSDYRGEVMCPMINLGNEDYIIKKGDRIGQMVFTPIARVTPILVTELDETQRGDNGFGSTGR